MLNRKTLSPEFSTPACHHGCFSPGCPSSSPWSPETQKQEHLGADPSLFLTLKPTQVPHLPPGLPPFVAIVTTASLHLPLTGCNPRFLLETWLFTENLPVRALRGALPPSSITVHFFPIRCPSVPRRCPHQSSPSSSVIWTLPFSSVSCPPPQAPKPNLPRLLILNRHLSQLPSLDAGYSVSHDANLVKSRNT